MSSDPPETGVTFTSNVPDGPSVKMSDNAPTTNFTTHPPEITITTTPDGSVANKLLSLLVHRSSQKMSHPRSMSVRLFHLKNETNSSCPDLKGQNYRASFHTRSSAKGPRKKIYRAHLEGDGPRKGEHAVVKVFRTAPGTESICDAEMAKHVLARKLARKFNKMVPDASDKIAFTMPLKSTVDKVGMGSYLFHHSRHLDKSEWVLIEENLVRDQQFQLFLRKNGDRAGKDPTSLDAFMHFTYMESGQKYVMCGFQGIHTQQGGYKLTTPGIQSLDQRYGNTDKGLNGIKSVFSKHKCNNLCWNWPKPDDHENHEPLEVSSECDTDSSNEGDNGHSGATSTDSTVAFGMDTICVALNDIQDSVMNGSRSGDSGDSGRSEASVFGENEKHNGKVMSVDKSDASILTGERSQAEFAIGERSDADFLSVKKTHFNVGQSDASMLNGEHGERCNPAFVNGDN